MAGDGQSADQQGTRDLNAPPTLLLPPNERTGIVALGNLPAGRSQILFTLSSPYADANYVVLATVTDGTLGGAAAGIVVERISSQSAAQFSVTVNNQTAGAIATSSLMYHTVHA